MENPSDKAAHRLRSQEDDLRGIEEGFAQLDRGESEDLDQVLEELEAIVTHALANRAKG
jgi:hypothetical protein